MSSFDADDDNAPGDSHLAPSASLDLSPSPHSATSFHALYSSPGPRLPPRQLDEIDADDLAPDSDDDDPDDDAHSPLPPSVTLHAAHGPEKRDSGDADASDQQFATSTAAPVAPATEAVLASLSPVAVTMTLDDAFVAAAPPAVPSPSGGEAAPADRDDDLSSLLSSDEGSVTDTNSVASLQAHLLSSSSPVISPTAAANRASLADLLHSMTSPPVGASSLPTHQQNQASMSTGADQPDDDAAPAALTSHLTPSAAGAATTPVPSSPSADGADVATPPAPGSSESIAVMAPYVSPAVEPDHSGVSAAFAHVSASLDSLQQALRQQAAAVAASSAAEQSAFESASAELQRRSAEIEEALRSIASQRTNSAERLEFLRSSLVEHREQISSLESSRLDLETKRASLSAARARRLALDYARAQPLHVLLRHTEGSQRGDHRHFLRQYRREQKAAARANCNDNIHDSASESDGEDGSGHGDGERGDRVAAPVSSAAGAAAGAAVPTARTTRHKSVLSTSSRGVDGLMARRDSKAAADRARRNSLPQLLEIGSASGAATATAAAPATAATAAAASPIDGGGWIEETAEDLPSDWVPPLDAQNRPIYPRRYGSYSGTGDPGSARLVLPRAVLEHMWTYLGVRDLTSIASACHEWRGLLERPAPHGTRVWKLLHQRVSGVDARLRQERERDKVARRTSVTHAPPAPSPAPMHPATPSASSNPHSLPLRGDQALAPNASTAVGNDFESGSSSPTVQTPAASPSPSPFLASRSRQGSTIFPSTPGASGGSYATTSVVPTNAGGTQTPSTPAPATPGKTGLLGGMLRRFRAGSSSNLNAGGSTPSGGGHPRAGAAAPHRGSWVHSSDAASTSVSFPPTHLHYHLRVDIPSRSRDSYTLTIEARLARSFPADTRVCMDEPESDPSNSQNSVSMHVCSLRPPPHPQAEEAEFCGQMFALQANLTQAKIERAKILAQIDGDEGVKKQITSEIQSLGAKLSQMEHEIDHVRQQNSSDAVTLDFLAQQLQHMEAALADERARTIAAALERKEKDEAAEREATLRDTTRQQQAELHTQLRGQKRQLTKEVKTVQVELEQEKEARDAVQNEYEQLVRTLAALKGAS